MTVNQVFLTRAPGVMYLDGLPTQPLGEINLTKPYWPNLTPILT